MRTMTKTADKEAAAIYQFALLGFMAIALYIVTINMAYASNTPMGFVLCNVVNMIYGNLGRGLATLAVLVLGVGATLGKVTWGLAITVAIGISVIFNAGNIVSMLGVGAAGC